MNPVVKDVRIDRPQGGAALFGLLFCSAEAEFLNQACRWLCDHFGAESVSLQGAPVPAFIVANASPRQPVTLAAWPPDGPLDSVRSADQLEPAGSCCPLEPGDDQHTAEVCRFERNGDTLSLLLESSDPEPVAFYYLQWGDLDERCTEESVHRQLRSERLRLVLERSRIELERFRETRRRESELSTLQSAISCFPGLVFAKDMDRRYVVVNKTLCEYNRSTPQQICGQRFEDLPGLGKSDAIEQTDQLALQGEHVSKEHELTYFGEARYFRGQKSPILDHAGDQVGICGVYHDITDLRNAERQLQQANAFQAAVIEKACEGVAVVKFNDDGRNLDVVLWNRRLTAITGISPDDNVARRLSDLFARNRRAVLQGLVHINRGTHLDQEEWTFQHPDGDPRVVVVSTASIAEPGQNPSIVFFVNDITRRHRIQQTLEGNQQRYELATKYSRSSVWEWHVATNTIEHCTLAETLGYKGVAFRTVEQWVDKIHVDDRSRVYQAWNEFIERKQDAFVIKFRMLNAAGEWRWIDCHGQFLDGDPRSGIVFGTDRDITEQVITSYRVKELQDEMQKISRLTTVSEMAASLAHEITQPVTAMKSYAAATRRLLDQEKEIGPEADIRRYIEKIEENAKNATEIMHVVRSLCSPAAMVLSRHVLGDITGRALEVCEVELRRRQIEVRRISNADDEPVQVSVSLVVHVLMNLISNACEALEQNPIDQRVITLTSNVEDGQAVILLSDNGPGISRSIGDTLFQPFVTTKPDGMGVGLAICKRIMDAHDGEISVQECAGSGATFRLRFPQIN